MNERHAGRVKWRFPEDHGQGEGKGILIIRRDGTQMGAERSLGRLEESGRIEMGKQLGTAERRKRSYPVSVAQRCGERSRPLFVGMDWGWQRIERAQWQRMSQRWQVGIGRVALRE